MTVSGVHDGPLTRYVSRAAAPVVGSTNDREHGLIVELHSREQQKSGRQQVASKTERGIPGDKVSLRRLE